MKIQSHAVQKYIESNVYISPPFPGLILGGTSSNSLMKSTGVLKSKSTIGVNFSLHICNLNQYKHIFFKMF